MKVNKVIEKQRLNKSDSFTRNNLDLLICHKCDQVLQPELEPKECMCGQAFYCNDCCINPTMNWVCNACRELQELEPINDAHLSILKLIKFYCSNRIHGCHEKILINDLHQHETKDCKFLSYNNKSNYCPFCSLFLKDFPNKKNHICNQLDQSLCAKHKTNNFSLDRIANLNEVQCLLDHVKCNLCSNLLKNPKQCAQCKLCYCEGCIVQSLLMQNYCPNCYQKEPLYSNVQRNINQLLNNFKLFCKNSNTGCTKSLSYKEIILHEENCTICTQCNSNNQYNKCNNDEGNVNQRSFLSTCFNCLRRRSQIKSQLVNIDNLPITSNIIIQRIPDQDQQASDLQQQLLPNDRSLVEFDRTSYLSRIIENIRQYYLNPSKLQIFAILLTSLIDPFLQNAMIILLVLYHNQELFITSSIQSAFYLFACSYIICTLIASIIIGLSVTARGANQRKLKWFQMILSSLNLQYFLFMFVPSIQNQYYSTELYSTIKVGGIIRNLPQILFAITIIVILCINQSSTDLGAWTLGCSISIIPFNVMMNIVMLNP